MLDAHTGLGIVPTSTARVERLIIDGALGRVLMKTLPQGQ